MTRVIKYEHGGKVFHIPDDYGVGIAKDGIVGPKELLALHARLLVCLAVTIVMLIVDITVLCGIISH